MLVFFSQLPTNIIKCFSGYNLIFHLLAIFLTFFLVTTGFDRYFFESTRSSTLRSALFPAVALGAILPIVLPLALLLFGKITSNFKTIRTAWALGQAELLALLISSFYKAFTGRVPPRFFISDPSIDMSQKFQFGFLKGGIFWGWPSSHATVAFAMAITLLILYPKNIFIRYLALSYAIYVGVGVSMTIHWFSDFVAGAIIGSVIGTVVGKSFLK